MNTLFIKLKVNHIFQQTINLFTYKALGKIQLYRPLHPNRRRPL